MRPEDNPQNWHQQKTYESLITLGTNAIKLITVINGGSILSLLTFIGSHQDKAQEIAEPMCWFIAGILIGGIVNMSAYFTQLTLFNQRNDPVPFWRDHRLFLYSSAILIFAGLICFAIGAFKAILALAN